MLFASDFPFDAEGGAYLVRETLRAIDGLGLSEDEKGAMFEDNLARLLRPTVPCGSGND